MRLRQALPVAAAVTASLAATAAAAKSPAALATALAHTKVTAAQLPHGYKSPVVAAYKISAGDKTHGAVGGASIVADHGAQVVIYIVFETAAQAKADFEHGNFGAASHKPAPGSIPKPNVEVSASTSGKVGANTVTIGITEIAFPYGNVLVQAATSSQTSTKHGDVAGAVALAQFALSHLKSVG
jgi:hypothetical protein